MGSSDVFRKHKKASFRFADDVVKAAWLEVNNLSIRSIKMKGMGGEFKCLTADNFRVPQA